MVAALEEDLKVLLCSLCVALLGDAQRKNAPKLVQDIIVYLSREELQNAGTSLWAAR